MTAGTAPAGIARLSPLASPEDRLLYAQAASLLAFIRTAADQLNVAIDDVWATVFYLPDEAEVLFSSPQGWMVLAAVVALEHGKPMPQSGPRLH